MTYQPEPLEEPRCAHYLSSKSVITNGGGDMRYCLRCGIAFWETRESYREPAPSPEEPRPTVPPDPYDGTLTLYPKPEVPGPVEAGECPNARRHLWSKNEGEQECLFCRAHRSAPAEPPSPEGEQAPIEGERRSPIPRGKSGVAWRRITPEGEQRQYNFRRARGVSPTREGDELPEERIRRLRDAPAVESEGEAQTVEQAREALIREFVAAAFSGEVLTHVYDAVDRFEAAIRASATREAESRIGDVQRANELVNELLQKSLRERDKALAALEDAKRGLRNAEAFLVPLLCEDVTVCQHPACEAWIAAGLTLTNLNPLSTEAREGDADAG